MNTFRGVREALEYEEKRQAAAIAKGEKIFQQTRLWNADALHTEPMRTKVEAHDYRYFPEPDLLDFLVHDEFIIAEKSNIKELPLAKRNRFLKEYALSERDTDILLSDILFADFFEEACRAFNQPQKISNWLLGPFLEQVNLLPQGLGAVKISPQNFAKVVRYFIEGKLNNLAAKKIISLTITSGEDIDAMIQKEGLVQVSAEADLEIFTCEVIKENPKAANEYLEGKEQAIMFLVGAVMKKTKGKANPKVVRQLLEKQLKNHR
jgi:aspartyl-tRNA(Asn)/glutamyl-tRNA(Gln) amidotransferase subunit B